MLDLLELKLPFYLHLQPVLGGFLIAPEIRTLSVSKLKQWEDEDIVPIKRNQEIIPALQQIYVFGYCNQIRSTNLERATILWRQSYNSWQISAIPEATSKDAYSNGKWQTTLCSEYIINFLHMRSCNIARKKNFFSSPQSIYKSYI